MLKAADTENVAGEMTTTSISLGAAPDKRSPSPTVGWLREKRLAAGFGTDAELARAIDASAVLIHFWVHGKRTPTSRYIEPLAAALGVTPPEIVAALSIPQRRCPDCHSYFTPTSTKQEKCSNYCRHARRHRWLLDTDLKVSFASEVYNRRGTLNEACLEMGRNRGTMTSWLLTPEGRLSISNLEPLARWLGLSINEAIRLQGGTAEGRQREIAVAALAPLNDNLASRKRRLKAATRAAADVNRGRRLTDAHRGRLRESLKAARAQDDPRRYGRHNGTLRGQARHMLGALKWRRPGLSADQYQAEAVARLLAPPYNVRIELEAIALLQPQKRRRGRPQIIDWFGVIVLRAAVPRLTWEEIGLQSDRDPDDLRRNFIAFLNRIVPN